MNKQLLRALQVLLLLPIMVITILFWFTSPITFIFYYIITGKDIDTYINGYLRRIDWFQELGKN